MSSWRDTILDDFVPKVSKLTLVADPDGLLTEEKLAMALRDRGFDLIEFNDSVAFRYAYESTYRSVWDRGEYTDLVVILRLQNSELDALPYDLLKAGRKLSFNLGELFPNLSYPVVEQLDRSLLDSLFDAQLKSALDRMGDNATRDFILRHVFGIAAELISTEVELLRALLRMHYGKEPLPKMLCHRLIQVLQGHAAFKSWPLEEIVSDDKAFFAFLQERWPAFLAKHSRTRHVSEEPEAINFRYSGPASLPFDHQDIKVFIDNLFLEGKLTPIEAQGFDVDDKAWFRVGIAIAGADDEELRASRLLKIIEDALPTERFRYSDWIAFALKWAELSSLTHSLNSVKDQNDRYNCVGDALNDRFTGWLHEHYASLINLPPTTPAMLHHVPRRLVRDMEDSGHSRVALVVVDGLALDQWVTIRQLLHKQDANLVMRESATFAWIPTLTAVSRQSIFSGKPPLYFPSSINSSNSEEKLWKQFWEGHGISRLDIAYQRGLGDGDVSALLDALIHPGSTKVVGLVVDKVDKIMHGMQLGAAGMHNQIRQWCRDGFLGGLIEQLLDYGFSVWLTSDHGNIECRGKGRPQEGVLAETKGERVRVYPSPELRSIVSKEYDFSYEWQPIGLPPGYYPLMAGERNAFSLPETKLVGHGGCSIEEVIVPLVKFERGGKR